MLPPAKKIAVNGVVLHYSGVRGDTDQPVAFPFAELHATVTLEDSSPADCILYRPFLAEAVENN